MKTKYFNDAIIGNKNLKATFSKKGELLRLFYPTTDYKQFIEKLYTGVKINDSWNAKQWLEEGFGNILNLIENR